MLDKVTSLIHIKGSYVKIITIALLSLYLLPYILFRGNVHVWTHDNLDSVLIYNKVLAESGMIFAKNSDIIPNLLGGLPRSCFGSEFYFTLWLYYFFTPLVAYIFNLVFLHLVAFIGAILLLKAHVFKNNGTVFIYPVALCFALMPFWSPGCLSVAGQPLLLYAFLNIRKRIHSYVDFLIVIIFPLFSSLVFSGLFFVIGISFLFLYDTIKFKKINWLFFLAICSITLSSLLVDYRLLLSFFVAPDFISHRVEFNLHKEILDVKGVFIKTFESFKYAQYHANSIHYPYIFSISLIALAFGWIYKRKETLKILVFMIIAFCIMFFYKFLEWERIVELTKKSQFLNTFQINRFYTLFPLIWFLILGFSCHIVSHSKKLLVKYIIMLLVVCQICFSFFSSSSFMYSVNEYVFHKYDAPKQFPRYRDFYAEDVFSIIKKGIGKPLKDYHVVNIGIDPAITAYNGFYTLDMYVANYPLDYKRKFRKVMEKELDKNPVKKNYFDTWGSRCYLFPAELDSAEINKLELNYDVLKEMDCEFLFSSKKINNAEKNLQFITKVKGTRELKYVYIYKLV